jgi:flagella basal body P-ring formation protein FlgA
MRVLLLLPVLMGTAFAEVRTEGAVPRGAVLTEADLSGSASEVERFVGLEARRPLFAGRVVRASDVQVPRAVRRQEAVTIHFKRGALTLRTEGRAMADGAVGDSVDILLEGRRAPISARIIGPGLVEVVS